METSKRSDDGELVAAKESRLALHLHLGSQMVGRRGEAWGSQRFSPASPE